jgi:acetoin utilization protein AcuB
MTRLRDWMTPDPEHLPPDASALEALERMIDRGIRHLPIVDARARLVGVVSIDDLRAALPFSVSLRRPPTAAERESALECALGELMTHAPLTATPETTLEDGAALLARFRIGCLPVVDAAGRLVGIFSETDALRALVAGKSAPEARPSGRALDLELLHAELRAERERIARQLERARGVERTAAAPADSRTDRVEEAERRTELAVDEPLTALAQRRLETIDRALGRARLGRLGVCEKCGGEIPVARLRALPGATLCLRCASNGAR